MYSAGILMRSTLRIAFFTNILSRLSARGCWEGRHRGYNSRPYVWRSRRSVCPIPAVLSIASLLRTFTWELPKKNFCWTHSSVTCFVLTFYILVSVRIHITAVLHFNFIVGHIKINGFHYMNCGMHAIHLSPGADCSVLRGIQLSDATS